MKKKEKSIEMTWLVRFASKHKSTYILSVLLAIASVTCSMMPYFLMGDMIGKLIEGNRAFSDYLVELVLMVMFWFGKSLFHSLSTTLSHIATFKVLADMRKTVCDKLAKLPLGTVKDTPSGSIKNIIVERIDSIETTLAHIVPEFTSNLLAPIGILIFLFFLDWRMALASLATVPIGIFCSMGMMIGYEENWKNTIVKTKELNDTAVEYINGIEVIKAFGKEKISYAKFANAAKEGASCFVEWMRKANIFFTPAMVIFPSSLIAVLPIGGILVRNGSLSVADFILTIILSVGLIAPILACSSYTDDIAKVKSIVKEMTDILEEREQIRPKEDLKKIDSRKIELKDVRFAYREKEILHGINMEIEEGSINAFVGPSGSGKSTIAKLIAALWDVDQGSISIGGIDIKDLTLESYNREIAYVSQDNYLFNMTIRENIRMGKKGATDEEVESVARKSGCHEFIMELEDGYETIVGDAGGHVSGGERQRIAIARAMLKDAPIVILDEATAYTDPENEAIIQKSVAKLVQGKTLLVIAHRLSTIQDADHIFVIADGEIDSKGTHEELLQMNGLYKNMWEAHISVKDDVVKNINEGGKSYA